MRCTLPSYQAEFSLICVKWVFSTGLQQNVNKCNSRHLFMKQGNPQETSVKMTPRGSRLICICSSCACCILRTCVLSTAKNKNKNPSKLYWRIWYTLLLPEPTDFCDFLTATIIKWLLIFSNYFIYYVKILRLRTVSSTLHYQYIKKHYGNKLSKCVSLTKAYTDINLVFKLFSVLSSWDNILLLPLYSKVSLP